MIFKTPQQVLDTIQAGDEVERIRGDNRVQINNQANGRPPLSTEQARKWNLKVNVNWNEFALLLAQACRQYRNAFLGASRYFTVRLPEAPQDYREQWSLWITQKINRLLKRSRKYFFLKDNQIKQLVAHGIGPVIWYDKETVVPDFVAIEDCRVATDTTTDLDNLIWNAIRKAYTPGELARKVWGEHADKHWNKPAVAQILHNYWKINFDTTPYDWLTAPEKMAELVKQNLGYFSSDAVPVIQLWHFYYYDETKPKNCVWRMHVLPERNTVRGVHADVFLYDGSDEVVADNLLEFFQVQFADLSIKAPAMWHSIRSLGFILLEPCYWTNLARCRSLQHTFESFMWLLRSNDPAGRAKASKVEFMDRTVIPEGISFEPNENRPMPDKDMVEFAMAQLKQLMNEASATYTQQADTGTKKEQTAFETRVKLSQVNAMMSAIISYAMFQENFADIEMCRRLCIPNSQDPMAREFQAFCKKKEIPRSYLDVDAWEVMRDTPLGGGNPMLEQAEGQSLMEQREKFSPEAQQLILHKWTSSLGGPDLADQLAPIENLRMVSPGQERAEFLFSTLMFGVPANLRADVSPIEQIETLLGMAAGVVARLEQMPAMATPGELVGLQNVEQHIAQLIQALAQNPAERQRAKEYQKQLAGLMKTVSGIAANAQKAMAAQNGNGGMDPQAMGKVQGRIIEAQAKANISEAAAAQKRQHKQKDFVMKQNREDEKLLRDMNRQDAQAVQKMQHSRLQTFNNDETPEGS